MDTSVDAGWEEGEEGAALAGARVLIADASVQYRATLRAIVESLGAVDVAEAGNIDEIAAALHEADTQVMLCGSRFSDGRNGAQLLEELRERQLLPAAALVVVIGGERTRREVAAVAELGPDAVILKPFSRDDVVQRLLRYRQRKLRLGALLAAADAGRIVEAVEGCRRLAAEQPSLHSEAYRLVCERLLALGRFELLAPLLREAMALRPLPWALLMVARLRWQEHQLDEACRIAEGVVHKWPSYLAGYDLLAQLNEQLGRPEQALEWLDRAAEVSAFNLRRLRRSGEIALRSGNLPRAEQAYARIVERTGPPASSGGADYANLIQVMLARGRFEAAQRVIEDEADRLGDGHGDAQVTRILFELARARRDEDAEAIDGALETLAQRVREGVADLSPTLLLQGLEVCAEFGRHETGYPLAQQIAHSTRIDRLMLQRARLLVDRLRRQPRVQMSVPAVDEGAAGEGDAGELRLSEAI